MELIISVIALIAGVSLYDYFSARHWQQVTSAERNDTVFASRNREYGAYQIRKNYDIRMLLILGGMIFTIGSAYGIYRIIKALPQAEEVEVPLDLSQFAMDAPKLKEELDPPVEEEIPPMEKTVQFLEPVVLDDAKEKDVYIESDVKVSTTTNDPVIENFNDPVKPVIIPIEKPKEPEIFTYVDEPATFKGNLKQYLAENINYPQTAQELGIEGKCYLLFIVSTSGNISNVEVKRGVPDCPECDKEAVRVVKGMPNWTPGKNGGKAVNSTFNLPISFKLQ